MRRVELHAMGQLNNFHKRSVAIGFQDIHQRLTALEEAIACCERQSPLSEYVRDMSPTETKVVQDYFSRVRGALLDCLEQYEIPLESRRISLRWALQTGLAFVGIAVDELGPEHLRGYGALDSNGRAILRKIQQEIDCHVDRVSAYVRQGAGQDLAERLESLQKQPAHVGTLQKLNKAVLRWKLVEFQPTLQTIVRRLEVPQFEIAVFGRVNSGKSSLLNHLVGVDVLPVGVTPITAVPTRLMRGRLSSAVIHFAEASPSRIDVAQLREYASEKGNPGNAKHVTGIEVELSAPRLHEGVVLVDTPGVGSLALTGSAETYAYLPRCDLSIVLVDAATTLSQEDLTLVRLLYEAGITVHVLLSKADLLNPADRQHALEYIRQQLRHNLGVEPPVHAVCAIGADAVLLDAWFVDELKPLLAPPRAGRVILTAEDQPPSRVGHRRVADDAQSAARQAIRQLLIDRPPPTAALTAGSGCGHASSAGVRSRRYSPQ